MTTGYTVIVALIGGLLVLLWMIWIRIVLIDVAQRKRVQRVSIFARQRSLVQKNKRDAFLLRAGIVRKWKQAYLSAGLESQHHWSDAFIIATAAILLITVVVGVVSSILFGIVAGFVVALTLVLLLRIQSQKHEQKMLEALPELLELFQYSLQAGLTQQQSWKVAVDEAAEPLKSVLLRVSKKMDYHFTLEDVLSDVERETGIDSVKMISTVISVQDKIGGNLTHLLGSISRTLRQQQQIQRDVRVLTSQGRLSGIFIAALWPISFILLQVMSPGYVDVLFTTPLGQFLLVGSLVLEVIGFLIIRRIMSIDL